MTTTQDGALAVTYYYENSCGSCSPEQAPLERLGKQLSAYVPAARYRLRAINSFQDEAALERELERLGLQGQDARLPLLVVGDRHLSGAAIEAQSLALFGELLGFEPRRVSLYGRPSCPDCVALEPAVRRNVPRYPQLLIEEVDITEDEPKEAFKALLTEEEVPQDLWQIPFIISEHEWISCPDLDEDALVQFLDAQVASLAKP